MPNNGFEDEGNLGEELVTGGIEEAAHDQMVEARRDELEQERDRAMIGRRRSRSRSRRLNLARPAARRAMQMLERYRQVRDFSHRLCETLEPEDFVVQSMPDVSPTKWHLAHTSWFFETFILKVFMPGYQPEVPEYAYLFNSYYNAAGDMHRRDLRGLISRPTVAETYRFRHSVDAHVSQLLETADEALLDKIEPVFTIGLHHEQQHQELLVTDIKHVFSQNPLHPIFREQIDTGESREIAPVELRRFRRDEFSRSVTRGRLQLRQRKPASSRARARFFARDAAGDERRISRASSRMAATPGPSIGSR